MTPLAVNGATSASLKVTDLPPGVTASLASTSVDLTSTAVQTVGLTINVTSTIQPGIYNFDVNYVAGTSNESSEFEFTVVPHIVFIAQENFYPANLTISAGQTVTWMNLQGVITETDPGYHNVTFQGNYNAASPTLEQYQVWANTFTAAGTYDYICTIHPFMHGQVVVTG